MTIRGIRIRNRFWVILAVVILAFFVHDMVQTEQAIDAQESEIARLSGEVSATTQSNDDLRRKIDFVQTDAYVEQAARDQLKLLKDGEIRFVAQDGEGIHYADEEGDETAAADGAQPTDAPPGEEDNDPEEE